MSLSDTRNKVCRFSPTSKFLWYQTGKFLLSCFTQWYYSIKSARWNWSIFPQIQRWSHYVSIGSIISQFLIIPDVAITMNTKQSNTTWVINYFSYDILKLLNKAQRIHSQIKSLKWSPLLLLAPRTAFQPRCRSCTCVQEWGASFAPLSPACIWPEDDKTC